MSTLPSYLGQLNAIESSFDEGLAAYEQNKSSRNDKIADKAIDDMNKSITETLRQTCDLVRAAAQEGNLSADDMRTLLMKASDHENSVVDFTYGGESEYLHDFIPICCGNEVSDKGNDEGSGLDMGYLDIFAELLQTETWVPIRMIAGDSMMAMIGATGWKQRDPALALYPLVEEEGANVFANQQDVDVGLADVARELALDETRKLAFVADSSRIKSYKWTDDEDDVLPVHTLDSRGYEGALLVRDGGAKLLRSGKSGFAVWDVDSLPTHGSNGRKIVGKKMRRENLDSWRDDDGGDEIELSRGAPPTQSVAADALKNIEIWRAHPGNSNSVLAKHGERYSPSLVDIEAQQIVTRYIGHGAHTTAIGTSKEDPNGFLTAAKDGGVRLYDVRLPAPVLAINHCTEMIFSALYEHIGGHPFIILGGSGSQQVKVWDVRGRVPLYQLSTGNNEVSDLAWDASLQTLFAATECQYMDRMGSYHDYRPAKFRDFEKPRDDNDGDEDMEDDEDYEDEDDEDDEDRCWPKRAYHTESSFGYPLDSGDHRIYSYKFKNDADVTILPSYGQATCGGGGYDW
ncbi:hypothetical protein EWM64_g4440 [Hericium alpestre]|uniref:Uncharacterized protein n=1 Tax=Hericium alpestre TaxID=135208 RepID=A0A4Y9ZZU2_9AGAM|nr:hypothetical protein EWM64_g4440 [Hericium alpestre]